MSSAFRFLAAVAILTLVPSSEIWADGVDCTRECLVKIEGVQQSYSEHARSIITIRNLSAHEVVVNVAAEGLSGSSWEELDGSISDPSHAFMKTKLFRKIETQKTLNLEFSPCAVKILVSKGTHSTERSLCSLVSLGEGPPSKLRLRVDVVGRPGEQIEQRVRSIEFGFEIADRPKA